MTILKEIRESCKMSTAELSRRSGVHRRDIYNLEQGKCRKDGNKKLYRVLEALSEKIELAYVAGLVDRASSITITKNKAGHTKTSKSPHYIAKFILCSIHLEICEIVRNILKIGEVSYSRNSKGNKYYQYYAHCKSAGTAIEKLLPYLKIKRAKAETLLEFRKCMEDYKLQYKTYLDSGKVSEWDQSIPNDVYETFYQKIRQC